MSATHPLSLTACCNCKLHRHRAVPRFTAAKVQHFPEPAKCLERKFATTQTIVVTQTLSILDNDNFLNESGMLRKLSYKLFSKTNLQSARSVSKLVQTSNHLNKATIICSDIVTIFGTTDKY